MQQRMLYEYIIYSYVRVLYITYYLLGELGLF